MTAFHIIGRTISAKMLTFVFDKSELIGVIQALAFLMECQGFAVKREQTTGEARKVQANSFKFINQIVRKILSL